MTRAVPMSEIDKELRILGAKWRVSLNAGGDGEEIMSKIHNLLDFRLLMKLPEQTPIV